MSAENNETALAVKESPSESPAKMEEPETRPTPEIDPAAIASAASGFNSFTLALYQQVPKTGNTLLSPFSVTAALSLLELGAKGDASAALLASVGADSDSTHRSGLQGLMAQLTRGA